MWHLRSILSHSSLILNSLNRGDRTKRARARFPATFFTFSAAVLIIWAVTWPQIYRAVGAEGQGDRGPREHWPQTLNDEFILYQPGGWADSAHHITTCPLDIQTFLRPCPKYTNAEIMRASLLGRPVMSNFWISMPAQKKITVVQLLTDCSYWMILEEKKSFWIWIWWCLQIKENKLFAAQ